MIRFLYYARYGFLFIVSFLIALFIFFPVEQLVARVQCELGRYYSFDLDYGNVAPSFIGWSFRDVHLSAAGLSLKFEKVSFSLLPMKMEVFANGGRGEVTIEKTKGYLLKGYADSSLVDELKHQLGYGQLDLVKGKLSFEALVKGRGRVWIIEKLLVKGDNLYVRGSGYVKDGRISIRGEAKIGSITRRFSI
ncbi:conserved hypothetical protein [Thermosulfidibacter takaii ABI70S6]|uniref:Type II secretion system protein GspN n=1 Tax=Thermosulfidibacter takaii (strain DSM 17441 / JCM 13301 / NBRC 103674 / ABI70S6) TaxID=1298851 RepID=A0A0S3QVS2_THET7|nr:hypothetical protein [Thermosulfidibacter takaii]BAT72418.1 conserved hypothetical protein [Thermosulfidibacter takaii ABI70S6]